MNKKLLQLLTIPLIITVLFFFVQVFLSSFRLGISSVVEEVSLDFKKTNQQDVHLLKGQKTSATFKATDNNLGILFLQLVKFGQGGDTLAFRIKEKGEEKWYHESEFRGDQVLDNHYFPLGFPPIAYSKNTTYVFEIESLSGEYRNGVGVIKDKPAQLMYKYSVGDLKNFEILWSFVSKKFLYTVKNIVYWQVVAVFLISSSLAFFVQKTGITPTKTVRFLLDFRTNSRTILKLTINTIISKYLFQKKKIFHLSKKATHWFISTKIYLLFLNTHTKKRLALGTLLFLVALTYRFSQSLVSYESLFYYQLGGQGDYDQFIRTGMCAIENVCVGILIYNFLIMTPILGLFFKLAGFIGGLKIFLFLMLFMSSLVATLPYSLLSRKNWLSFGGIIGGLYLATNDFLTNIALGFPSDNSSVFTFSIFYIVYLLTLRMRTIRWLILLGLVGVFDGFNKVLFLINNLGAFLLFIPSFFFEKGKIVKKSLFTRTNVKVVAKSSLPIVIFILIYALWEIITYTQFFKSRYFLWQMVFQGGRSWSAYVTGEGTFTNNLLSQVLYVGVSAIVMVKRLIEYSGLNIFFLTPIFLGMLSLSFIKRKFPMKHFIVTVLFSTVLISLLILIKENVSKIHDIFPGEYIPYNWKTETYLEIFLFFVIIYLSILNFKYLAIKFSLPIITYVVMLVFLAKGAPFARLHTHVIVWSFVFLAFVTDWILSNSTMYPTLKKKGVLLGPLLLIIFILVYLYPKTEVIISQLSSGFSHYQNEVHYLQWVNAELPENSIILGGNKEDLIVLGENVKKPIVYNSFFGAALLIPKNRDHRFVKEFKIVDQLKSKASFRKNTFIILEENINVWRQRLAKEGDPIFSTSSASLLNPRNYEIKPYKFNQALKKGIYELHLKSE